MFQGYYGRRRLKNILMIFVGVLMLVALFFRRSEPKIESVRIEPPNTGLKTAAPPSVRISKSGVMAAIEFFNSPYLLLQSFPTNVVPVMVLSRAANIEVRDAIRRTWGFYRSYRNSRLRFKIFFLVGTDDFMTERIRMEQNVFDDVIQVTLPDMYSFSAHKELAAMLWVRTYLPKHSFYIKSEDNVIVNMRVLVDSFLPLIESDRNQELIIGWFGSEHAVQRGTYQKFINAMVPASAGKLNYAMGLLYAVTTNAVDRMISTLNNIDLIEYPGDPFITGILRNAAHVQINNLAAASDQLRYEVSNGECTDAFTKDPDLLVCTSSLHTGSKHSMSEYFDAWNVLIGENHP